MYFLLMLTAAVSGCGDSSNASSTLLPRRVSTIQVAPQTTLSQGVSQAQLPRGVRAQYEATITYSDGSFIVATGGVTWHTSNDRATVSSSGVVTAQQAGDVVIEASLDGVTGQAALTVTDATLTALQLTPVTGFITQGSTRQWGAQGLYSDDTTTNLTGSVVWSSSDTTVASVATTGVVSAHQVGTAIITATFQGITTTAEIAVTGKGGSGGGDTSNAETMLASLTLTPATTTLANGLTQTFVAQGTLNDDTLTDLSTRVYWSSSNPTVATINASGLALAKAVGTTTITATLNGITSTATLTVSDATLTTLELTPDSVSLAKGLTQSFLVKGIYSDQSTTDLSNKVTWQSSNTTVATINTAGLASAHEVGNTTISATFNGIKSSATLAVTEATLTAIHLSPATSTIAKSAIQPLSALGTYSDNSVADLNSVASWRSSNTKVASVSPAGEVIGQGAGTTTITASLDGIKATANLEVTKGNQVITWYQYPNPSYIPADTNQLTNIKTIAMTHGAMAGLKQDGSVVTWGDNMYGADSSAVWSRLTNIKAIYANYGDFAALKQDGTVVTWGYSTGIGYNSTDIAFPPSLTNVQEIVVNYHSFAALKKDGTVVAWGRDIADTTAVTDKLTNVKTIVANGSLWASEGAFAALRQDGTVVTWGSSYAGGDSTTVEGELTNVQAVYSAPGSFAALRQDGSVVTWGNAYSGGDSTSVKELLVNVQTVVSNCPNRAKGCNQGGYAALRQDGSVVVWGSIGSDDSASLMAQLQDVKTVYANGFAFAALKQDGSVVTWGDIARGGDSTDVVGLSDVQAIYSTHGAFAALKKDGSVVTWGDSYSGGDSATVKSQLTDIQTVLSISSANSGLAHFVAIKSDGSNVIWGDPNYSQVTATLSPLVGIKALFSTPSGLSAAIIDEQ